MWVGAITGSPHRAAATVRTRAGSAIVTPPGCASWRWPCMSPVPRLTTMRSRWAVSTHNGAAAEAALPADGAALPADGAVPPADGAVPPADGAVLPADVPG